YLRPFFDLPPLTQLLHLHGAVFSAWLVLFVVQTRLVAAHNVRAHMKLGIAGAVLAALVVVLGVVAALVTAGIPHPRPLGLSGQQFLAVSLTGIVLFACCVASALALRRRPAFHKRLMVLAMIAVLGPPVARLILWAGAGKYFPVVQTSVSAVFVAWCLTDDWIRNRIVHPVFAIGGTVLVLSWPARFALAKSALWLGIGEWLTA
ncbi:MAG TPA: hypothetical protein VKB34_13645, partial [Povalibacter sp.]|nr:hypothetical protein [Povalibacter sp.]